MLKKIVAAIIIIGTASFLAVQIGTSAPDSSGAPPLLATVKRASFDVAITESGVLEALRSVTLCSEIPSNNAKIMYLVPEGTQVEKGDVLVSFDPTPFQEDVRKFQFQVNEAMALLDEARQEVELEKLRAEQERRAAKHAVRLAELQLERVEPCAPRPRCGGHVEPDDSFQLGDSQPLGCGAAVFTRAVGR